MSNYNYKYVQNYYCMRLSRVKAVVTQEQIEHGDKIVICLNKKHNVIDCGWVPKGRQAAKVYITHYLTPDEYKNLTEKRYTEIIYQLINEHKKILNQQKIKEIEKDFVENDQV